MSRRGFTIVELLIVIVVIGILAAISIVAYNNIQQKARDSQRRQNVSEIAKAMELFYTDKGFYPNSTTYSPGSTAINAAWATTADSSWANLESQLSLYVSKLPRDPISTSGIGVRGASNSYNYDVFVNQSDYCGVPAGQMYVIVFKLENAAQGDMLSGDCSPSRPVGPYAGVSNYRIVK